MTDRQSILSYFGALGSVVASLTMTDFGVLIGIVTALATFCSNYVHKRHQRKLADERHALEMAVHREQLEALRERRTHDEPIPFADRRHEEEE